MSLSITSLGVTNDELLAIADAGDEPVYQWLGLDHVSEIPSDFMSPLASLIIHEEELGAPIVTEHLYVDRDVDAYRPYSAAEFKERSARLTTEFI